MKSRLAKILERYPDDEFLTADGFDSAIIGVACRINAPAVVVYSVRKCLKVLAKDMSEEDAREYFDYNVVGAYMGEGTPIFVEDDL